MGNLEFVIRGLTALAFVTLSLVVVLYAALFVAQRKNLPQFGWKRELGYIVLLALTMYFLPQVFLFLMPRYLLQLFVMPLVLLVLNFAGGLRYFKLSPRQAAEFTGVYFIMTLLLNFLMILFFGETLILLY